MTARLKQSSQHLKDRAPNRRKRTPYMILQMSEAVKGMLMGCRELDIRVEDEAEWTDSSAGCWVKPRQKVLLWQGVRGRGGSARCSYAMRPQTCASRNCVSHAPSLRHLFLGRTLATKLHLPFHH